MFIESQNPGQGYNSNQFENRVKDFTPKLIQGKGMASPGFSIYQNNRDYSPDFVSNNITVF